MIPRSGSSPGEEKYPLQYSWISLVAQTVKNPSAMEETWVRSLDWEGSLEEGMVTHSSILPGESLWTQEPSLGFPGCSVGKESACNTGDPGLIPGLGRSLGEGIGHPLQYSWASLVAQMIKNLPAMRETWVRSLGCEDLLEEG